MSSLTCVLYCCRVGGTSYMSGWAGGWSLGGTSYSSWSGFTASYTYTCPTRVGTTTWMQKAQRQVCQSKMAESCSCMTNINLITQPEIIYIQFRPWKSLNAYNKNISAQTKINPLSVCCFFTLNEQTLKGAQSHQNMLPTHRCTWGNKNSAMAQS